MERDNSVWGDKEMDKENELMVIEAGLRLLVKESDNTISQLEIEGKDPEDIQDERDFRECVVIAQQKALVKSILYPMEAFFKEQMKLMEVVISCSVREGVETEQELRQHVYDVVNEMDSGISRW